MYFFKFLFTFFKKIFFFQKGKHNQKISSIIPDKVLNFKLYISLYSQYFFFDSEGLKKMLHSVYVVIVQNNRFFSFLHFLFVCHCH